MRLYLAGPMTGLPELNFPAFAAAAAILRARGHDVWSPAENDVTPPEMVARPHLYRWYMRRDLPALLDCDAVAVLPGWKRSKDACLEVHVARECGMPVLEVNDVSLDEGLAARLVRGG